MGSFRSRQNKYSLKTKIMKKVLTIIVLIIAATIFASCEKEFITQEELKELSQSKSDSTLVDSLGNYSFTIYAESDSGGLVRGVHYIITENESGNVIYNDDPYNFGIHLNLDSAKTYSIEMSKLGYDTVRFEHSYIWNYYTKYVIMPNQGEFYELTCGAYDLSTKERLNNFTYKLYKYGLNGIIDEGSSKDSLVTLKFDYGIEYEIKVIKDGYRSESYYIEDCSDYSLVYFGIRKED